MIGGAKFSAKLKTLAPGRRPVTLIFPGAAELIRWGYAGAD
jgi:hypothetical protein